MKSSKTVIGILVALGIVVALAGIIRYLIEKAEA